jgi:hypothetical protein
MMVRAGKLMLRPSEIVPMGHVLSDPRNMKVTQIRKTNSRL